MFSFLFYSHKDYSDLWGYLEEKENLIPFKKYLAVNENAVGPFPAGYEILRYDDKLSYSEKLISLFTQLNDIYVVLIHDNDLIITFDHTIFIKYIKIMEAFDISRLMFGVIGNDAKEKIETSEFRLGSTEDLFCPCFTIPYDVSPSIWNRTDFLSLLECVKGVSYREIENHTTQNLCRTLGLKIWGHLTHPTEKCMYVIGRPFPWRFQFLHLLVTGCLVLPNQYMDQKNNFFEIIDKYSDIQNRRTLTAQNHLNTCYRYE